MKIIGLMIGFFSIIFPAMLAIAYTFDNRSNNHTTIYSPSAADVRRAERERETKRKSAAARIQAEKDIKFYNAQLESLQDIESNTARLYYDAIEQIDADNERNKYSYVVPEKTIQKHITERDRMQKRLYTIQAQIHGTEKKIANAQYILEA